MSKEDFASIRNAADLSLSETADYLGVEARSVCRYISGERPIHGPVERLMRMLDAKNRRKQGRE